MRAARGDSRVREDFLKALHTEGVSRTADGIKNLESLLSKLAVHEAGVERAAYDGDGVSKLHHLTVEANPCDQILQHLQSVAPAFSARRVSGRRERLAGGTTRARLYVLGPIRGDAVR